MLSLCKKKLFLLDMDGTLYLDEELLPGAAEFLRRVRGTGGRYLYVTNNSSRGIGGYLDKLRRLGLPAEQEDFFTSVDATVLYLRERFGERARSMRVYLAGTRSFLTQMEEAGFNVTTELEDGIELVLSGFDRELTFRKLEDVCILLGRGLPWVATNPDWVCPTWYGFVPDCGSVCEMITRATGRRPDFVGKPEPLMARAAMALTGCAPEETLLIGDRIYTDIACGVNAGIDTVLVLCGETSEEDLARSETKPTLAVRDLAELAELWRLESARN